MKTTHNFKIILDKCLNYDINWIKEIIKDAGLKSCYASNKAIRMWQKYDEYIEDKVKKDMKENEDFYNRQAQARVTNQNRKIKNDINYYKKEIYDNLRKKYIKEMEDLIKKEYGKTLPNLIEPYMKEIMSYYNTSNVGTLHQQVVQGNWKRQKEDVLNYKANLSSFKEDMPYYIKNCCYGFRKKDNEYYVDISFFSKDGLKEYDIKRGDWVKFKIDKMGNNEIQTINKIMSKEYKQGSSQISISRKGKIELLFSVTFDSVEEKYLDSNRILGIDLGIVNVITMSIWDNTLKQYERVNYRDTNISGKELIKYRQKLYNMGLSNEQIEYEIEKTNKERIEKQLRKRNIGMISGLDLARYRNEIEDLRWELKIATKWSSKNKSKRGYNAKNKKAKSIGNRIARFKDTYNHKISRYVVDFAIKNGCGIIQMEDLSGFNSKANSKFLKDWSYYDLQEKITYKARESGIKCGNYYDKKGKLLEKHLVNPYNTSKRCSYCGNIHKENRNCKDNQARFECQTCHKIANADINASRNIALPNIDEIIKEYRNKKEKIAS